jgi:hypothetical protein
MYVYVYVCSYIHTCPSGRFLVPCMRVDIYVGALNVWTPPVWSHGWPLEIVGQGTTQVM